MKATGITKKIDELGRLGIPKEVRRAIGVKEGDELRFEIEGNKLILSKVGSYCLFCGSADDLTELNGKHICADCVKAISQV